MPIRANNTRTFHRTLYAGELESVILLKRDDDQRENVVRSIKLFDCRWQDITKQGQPIQGDQAVNHNRNLQIPRVELDRVGVNYINVLDRFQDKEGRVWQPETPQVIDIKTFENHLLVQCTRLK